MKGFSKFKGVSSASALAIGVAFGLVALVATPAAAVETTATLQGKVADAPQGTKVTARNVENGAKATVAVRADGTYDVVGLRPGNYEVTFLAPDGNVLVQTITLSVGETSYLDGDMKEATKAVVVVGRRGSANIKSSEIATSISRVQIESLPQQGRNFLNFAVLAPGVTVSTSDEGKTFRSGAVSADAVNVFIDGVSQKNQVIRGGVAGQDSSRGNPFPQGAIQEYKVSTQNFKAEYEQAASAIITAVTKSGTNELHGSAFMNYQSKSMIGQPYYQRNNPKQDYENKEYGFDIGGPIIKDKLFFYGTYEKRQDSRPASDVLMPTAVNLGNNATLATALASAYNGSFAKDFEQDTYFAKVTWLVNDKDTIDISYRDRQEDDMRDFGGTTAQSAGSNFNQYVREGSVQWKHRDGNLLNEAAIDYQTYHFMQSSVNEGPAIFLLKTDGDLGSVSAKIGGYEGGQEKAQDLITFKNNLTYSGLEWHGSHVIKAGVKLSNVEYTAREGAAATNPTLYYNASTYVLGGTNTPVGALVYDGDPSITAKNFQAGVFIQDDWTVNEKLTLNLGVRWDYESNMMNNKYVTPDDVAAAIRGFTGFTKVFNPEDYIAKGDRKAFTGAIQPRIGFSYDLNGDRKTVLFAGAGRYYDRTMFDRAQMELRRQHIHRIQLKFPADGAWNPSYETNTSGLIALAQAKGIKGEIFALNNDVKVPYSDQFNFGVRHKWGDINLSATVAFSKSYDLFNFLVGNRQADGSWGNGWAGTHGDIYETTPWDSTIPNYGGLFIGYNGSKARSKSLYLTADKPYTKDSGYGWSAKLDLNDSEMLGSDDWLFTMNPFPYITGWNHSEGTEKWRFVASGIVDGPWDTKLSGLAVLSSGPAFRGFIAAGTNGAPAGRFIPGAYFPKEKIGYSQVDLKIAKDFTLPNSNVITVEGQVFNVFDSVNNTYNEWDGGFSSASQPVASRKGSLSTTGPARSYQVGLVYKF